MLDVWKLVSFLPFRSRTAGVPDTSFLPEAVLAAIAMLTLRTARGDATRLEQRHSVDISQPTITYRTLSTEPKP